MKSVKLFLFSIATILAVSLGGAQEVLGFPEPHRADLQDRKTPLSDSVIVAPVSYTVFGYQILAEPTRYRIRGKDKALLRKGDFYKEQSVTSVDKESEVGWRGNDLHKDNTK